MLLKSYMASLIIPLQLFQVLRKHMIDKIYLFRSPMLTISNATLSNTLFYYFLFHSSNTFKEMGATVMDTLI